MVDTMEANHRLQEVFLCMLDELEYQATLNRTSHHFIYKMQDKEGIGKYLNHDEQAQLLLTLHAKGLIAGFGKNVFDHSEEGSYFVELEDKSLKKERERIKTPGFFDEFPTNKVHSSNEQRIRVSISYNRHTVYAEIGRFEAEPIARFNSGSDMQKIFDKIWGRVGVKYRNTDFEGFGISKNLRSVFTDRQYHYLLPFVDISPKDIYLARTEVELTKNELKQFLKKIKVKFRKGLTHISDGYEL